LACVVIFLHLAFLQTLIWGIQASLCCRGQG